MRITSFLKAQSPETLKEKSPLVTIINFFQGYSIPTGVSREQAM